MSAMSITKDDFLLWRDNAVTKWVFEAAEKAAITQSDGWMDKSWGAGQCDPLELNTLRTRADSYRALFETPYEQWAEMHGDSE